MTVIGPELELTSDPFGRRARWEYRCRDCDDWTRVYLDPEGVWEECGCSAGYVDAAAPGGSILAGCAELAATGEYVIHHGRASETSGSVAPAHVWSEVLDSTLSRHGLRRSTGTARDWHPTADGWRAYVFARDWSGAP